ncbi:ATP-binding protein [Kitasatospora sp. DSM 101779]|uniref:ATP-binding protein n=1 Tax=Kitasatospora sp. DSM 101779 TaxID=2853165 RepID=UPI0021D7E8ED|nr:ATP-binding protein [Kitasatospora sp. DSM 101779]MCU7820675.1 ATP-binding protein [Kitasatospora sp. DSM 101779]
MQTPIVADLTLPRIPQAVTRARHTMTALVAGCTVADDARLLISEAVANAVEHTAGPAVRILICHDSRSGELLCHVRDHSGTVPRYEPAAAADEEAEGGRGLHLITALSESWGYEKDAEGKQLWFRLLPPDEQI